MSGDVDMQAVVDRLAGALGQSVLIEDRDQRPVWWSTRGAVDPTRARTILDRRVDPAAAAVVRRFHLAKATAPIRTPALPDAEMWARWCMPIRSGARLLGFLWVLDPEETIGESELPALVECAELAAEVMSRSQQALADTRYLRDELLDRLLRSRDDEAARELARLEHLPHDAGVQVAAPGRPGGWPLPGDMSAHVARSRPRAAESGAPLPLIDLGEAARRAAATRKAIAAGARPDPPTWDHLGAWRLIVDAPAWLTVSEVHPGAAVLAAQPRSDLLTTARFFLDHGGDVAAAAAVLHVHRTTLYYRLDRIIERYRHQRTKAMGDISLCTAGPGSGQDAARHLLACTRQLGAKVSCETVTGIISLTPSQASPAQLLTRNRDHWGIENGLHHRRDTTYGEDASQVRASGAPRLLAAMNNLVISVLSRAGHANNAYARRQLGWDRTGGLRALELLGL